jgi:hypothetical protein
MGQHVGRRARLQTCKSQRVMSSQPMCHSALQVSSKTNLYCLKLSSGCRGVETKAGAYLIQGAGPHSAGKLRREDKFKRQITTHTYEMTYAFCVANELTLKCSISRWKTLGDGR